MSEFSLVARPNTLMRNRVTAITMAGLGALGLMAGCARETGSTPVNSDCSAISPSAWMPVPQEINVPRVADRLGRKQTDVMLGQVGTANCESGIDFDTVMKGAPVTVSGIPTGVSERCLTILSEAPPSPSPGAMVHTVGVLCPAK